MALLIMKINILTNKIYNHEVFKSYWALLIINAIILSI